MKKVNNWIKGFRTILLSWFGYGLMYVDFLVTNLSGLTKEALKGAAMMAVLVTLKQIKTDVLPKLRGMFTK